MVTEKSEQVAEVWKTYCDGAERNKGYVLDEKRRKKIEKALAMYPLQDVLDAVVGWKYSSFHRGQNDRHRKYNDIELILRDARHIEEMRDYYRAGHPEEHPVAPIEVEAWPDAVEMFARRAK